MACAPRHTAGVGVLRGRLQLCMATRSDRVEHAFDFAFDFIFGTSHSDGELLCEQSSCLIERFTLAEAQVFIDSDEVAVARHLCDFADGAGCQFLDVCASTWVPGAGASVDVR